MSGLGRKVFTAGSVLQAQDVMDYLMDQSVMVFAGTAARGSALGTAVSEGMVSYVSGRGIEVYNGTTWGPVESSAISPNFIINGAFEINQRGFSSTTSDNTFTFDRWRTFRGGAGTSTYSAQTFTPGTAPSAAIEGANFTRIVTSGQSANNDYSLYIQLIESVRTLAGQQATLSFYAKANSGTPKIAAEFVQNFGTGGSPSSDVNTAAGAVTLSTSWARYSITVNVPSITSKTIGTNNNDYLGMFFWLSAGSDFNSRASSIGNQNNTFDIWGVQLEAGSVATPFRRAANTLQGELAACQRYYQTHDYLDGARISVLQAISATVASGKLIDLPVPMRVAPTVSISNATHLKVFNATGGAFLTSSAVGLSGSRNNIATFGVTVASGLVAGNAVDTFSANNNCTLEASAEL